MTHANVSRTNKFKAKTDEHDRPFDVNEDKEGEEKLANNSAAHPSDEVGKTTDAESPGKANESVLTQTASQALDPEMEAMEAVLPAHLSAVYPPSSAVAAGTKSYEGTHSEGQIFAYDNSQTMLLAQAETGILVETLVGTTVSDATVASGIGLTQGIGLAALGAGVAMTSSKSSDTIAPTLAITSSASTLKAGETATITFTFSEDPGASFVWNGATGDVVVSGGTLGAISGTGLTRTATFTPGAGTASGSASISVASGSYSDNAGNGGEAAAMSTIAIDTVAPTLAITSSAELLQEGQTATITFAFSEDPGASFTLDDIEVAGGTLTELSDTGATRTATFTATASLNLSTGAHIAVSSENFNDLAGNAGTGAIAPSVSINTVFNVILFVGNSATFGRADPVMSYNTFNAVSNPGGVRDLTAPDQGGNFINETGTNLYEPHNWGGVPGLFDKFADQVGLSYDVSMSTRNAATLRGHYANTSPGGWDMRGNISKQQWDMVVLQDQTDEPLPGGFGSITFAPGSSTASLIVTPRADSVQEYDETLALTLASSANYRVGTSATITTNLLNDDPTAPRIDPNLATVTLKTNPGSVAEDGSSNLVFSFTRDGSTDSDLTVTFDIFRDGSTAPSVSNSSTTRDLEMYKTDGELASFGSGTPYRFNVDGFTSSESRGVNTTTGTVSFTSNKGTIVIKAGQTTASLTLDPRADTTVETDESIRITLTHPATGTDYNIGTASAITGTIVNDDFEAGSDTSLPNVTLALSSAASVYENAGQSLIYTFTRSGSTAEELKVNFKQDGTATYFASNASKSDFSLSSTGAREVTLKTTSGKNADIAAFHQYATLIEDYIHTGAADASTIPGTTIAANPNASAETDVYLYATWARPDMIAGAWDMTTQKTLEANGAYSGGTISQTTTQATAYYLTLEEMSIDLTEAYASLARNNTDFEGVAPVSTAFMAAVQAGIAIRDPYTETASDSVSTGDINLWFDDKLHASKFGSYLAGLTLFETLTGLDARVLGSGDKVAADLGIDGATAAALQQVASATLGFNQDYHWTSPGAVTDLGDTLASGTLATAGAFSFMDPAYTAHSVRVESKEGNLGTLTAQVRSDGHAGQVNWLYTVDNQLIDAGLEAGAQRMEYFTVLLNDGYGHESYKSLAIALNGGYAVI